MPRILLVDDEPVILKVLEELLAGDGRELVSAPSAAQALARAEEPGGLEVAILDKNLPDRTGLQLARDLRERHPDLEVIFMTGYPSLDSAVEALQLGACDYVRKPILDFEELSEKVAQAIERVRLKREQREARARLEQSERQLRELSETTGSVAHAFNNLLTVILFNGEVLLSRLGDDERRARHVRGILAAGGRSAELVRELARAGPKAAR
ncbi:MAG: response regulator [Myxococcales bacterium]|jgi:DNA-binding NtrC family response regulator